MPSIIQIRNLHKSYGSVVAVDDISFAVQPGEIFGLLGPNGAGKTTTLECLEGIRQTDRRGRARAPTHAQNARPYGGVVFGQGPADAVCDAGNQGGADSARTSSPNCSGIDQRRHQPIGPDPKEPTDNFDITVRAVTGQVARA